MDMMIDVARCILEQTGEISAMKLQKLMYYSQAWHMVWSERELFSNDFQAWANGPVIPELYMRHRGQFLVHASQFPDGDSSRLTDDQRESITKVVEFYGKHTAQWLSDLTHSETPWIEARGGLPAGAACQDVIPKGEIHAYYASL